MSKIYDQYTKISQHNFMLADKIALQPLELETILLTRLMALELKELEKIITDEIRSLQEEGKAKIAETFTITSGKIIVSDPCYQLNSGSQCIIENVQTGMWRQHLFGTRMFGGYVTTHQICCAEGFYYDPRFSGWEECGEITVDSGQAGMFDLDSFRDPSCFQGYQYKHLPIRPDDVWYSCVTDQTTGPENGGTVPFGCVSVSGFGDGRYLCSMVRQSKLKKVVAIKLEYVESEGELV